DSIVKASEKGKIKVKQVVDNTAKEVEILIHLQAGLSPEIAIDALYAFTDCEVSISPNACVIVEDKPQFMKVNDILRYNTEKTVKLLKQELEIRKGELMEKILFSSLSPPFLFSLPLFLLSPPKQSSATGRTALTGLRHPDRAGRIAFR
ncbi:hypothetical protein B4Q13_20020, partial [Lacticaseibacillus rhamnosus]